ncbi:NAD(P)/FAD-dependent oxidoreductase, partial [Acinetobacter baumannii]
THRGLSGPAILQISNYWKASEPVIINFRPEINWLELLRQKQNLSRLPDNLLSDYLPAKFADFIVRDVSRRLPLNQLRKEELDAI